MSDVGRLANPEHLANTLPFVSAILAAAPPASDADRLARDWGGIADFEARPQRLAFVYAYGMVRCWQLSTGWPGPDPAAGETAARGAASG